MSEVAPIRITEVQRLKIKPGDRLIAIVDRDVLTGQEARQIQERLRAVLGLDDIRIAVTTSEWTFRVVAK